MTGKYFISYLLQHISLIKEAAEAHGKVLFIGKKCLKIFETNHYMFLVFFGFIGHPNFGVIMICILRQ